MFLSNIYFVKKRIEVKFGCAPGYENEAGGSERATAAQSQSQVNQSSSKSGNRKALW